MYFNINNNGRFLIFLVILTFLIPSVFIFSEGMQEYEQSLLEKEELSLMVQQLSDEIEDMKEQNVDPYKEIGSVPGYNPRAKYYEVPEGFKKIDSRVRYIGNLRGSWEEMGYQYGERTGDLILNVFNYSVDFFAQRNKDINQLKTELKLYQAQIEAYAPEMMEFMKGIADGASWQLSESPYAEDMSDFEKILLVNIHLDLDFFPPKTDGGKDFSIEYSTHDSLALKEHCTGFACSGKDSGELLSPTKNGETIVVNNCDLAQFVPYGWNCVFIATPNDPDANTFWSIQPAGVVGGLNLCANDEGVSLGNFFGGQSEDTSYDYGVPMGVLQIHALAYADTADEAVEIMVFGDERYRFETNRKKVLQTGLWSYLAADSNEVMVLETTPNRHAVRSPGDMNETGNYVIYANWYGSKHYYDENNVFVNEPIGICPPEFPERYYTYEWFIKYNFGQIDEAMAKEGQKITYYYEKDTGRRIDFLEGSSYPLYLGVHTISAYWGAALGMDIGGTAHASQVIVEPAGRIKLNWVQGRPCEWVGPWQSADFFGYQK